MRATRSAGYPLLYEDVGSACLAHSQHAAKEVDTLWHDDGNELLAPNAVVLEVAVYLAGLLLHLLVGYALRAVIKRDPLWVLSGDFLHSPDKALHGLPLSIS